MTKRILMSDGERGDIEDALGYVRQLIHDGEFGVDELIVFIPTKAQLEQTSLAEVLGEPNSKSLLKGEKVPIAGVTTRLETERSFRHARNTTGILVVYADKSMMDKVDENPGAAFVVAVPANAGMLDRWRDTWRPQVHGEPQEAQTSQISDAVVERAIREVVESFNMSHGTLSAGYRDHAVRVLRTLRYLGHHTENPKNIRAWAVANGWKPSAADELETLAGRVFALKGKPQDLDRVQLERDKSRWIG